jgi:hypothetical protein
MLRLVLLHLLDRASARQTEAVLHPYQRLLRLAKLSASLYRQGVLRLVLSRLQVKLNVLSHHPAMLYSVRLQHRALVFVRQTEAAHHLYQRLLRLAKLSAL